ncbi:MAG: hypothetical protein JWM44_1935 [Bacilli bacterium]|jgi:hypothetical protein|nr:hypothetical protein [Bacilli bacterium]
MDNPKVSLDILTILSQLSIDVDKYAEWEKENGLKLWGDSEILDCIASTEAIITSAVRS